MNYSNITTAYSEQINSTCICPNHHATINDIFIIALNNIIFLKDLSCDLPIIFNSTNWSKLSSIIEIMVTLILFGHKYLFWFT